MQRIKYNFYEYRQNNSGGKFIQNDEVGGWVLIEARTAKKSEEVAFKIGIYFDGVNDGRDCNCCGDRWCEPNELVFPYRYGTFDKEEAEKIANKYKADFGKTTWKFMGKEHPDPNKYDVVFRDIKSYAQYKITGAWFKEHVIIYYQNGKKEKVSSKK